METGPEVYQLYRRAAVIAPSLDRPLVESGGETNLRFPHPFSPQDGVPLHQLMPFLLANTLMGRPDPQLCRLALELYGQ